MSSEQKTIKIRNQPLLYYSLIILIVSITGGFLKYLTITQSAKLDNIIPIKITIQTKNAINKTIPELEKNFNGQTLPPTQSPSAGEIPKEIKNLYKRENLRNVKNIYKNMDDFTNIEKKTKPPTENPVFQIKNQQYIPNIAYGPQMDLRPSSQVAK